MAPMRVVSVLAVFAVAANAFAQTLEDRAADVRRTIEAPPPVETVIDRGSRVVAPQRAAPQSAPVARPAEAVLPGQRAVPLAPEVNDRINRLLMRDTPGLRVERIDAGATGLVVSPTGAAPLPGTPGSSGTVGLGGFPPGVLVVGGGKGGQVTGASNLVTGSGVSPGVAP
jgi:hypothetical protein